MLNILLVCALLLAVMSLIWRLSDRAIEQNGGKLFVLLFCVLALFNNIVVAKGV